MNEVKSLREHLHLQVVKTRAIIRITDTESFEALFNGASESQKSVVRSLINDRDRRGLRQWITNRLNELKAVDELNIRELRKLGQRLGVREWYTIPRLTLISEIKRINNDGRRNPITPSGDAELDTHICKSM